MPSNPNGPQLFPCGGENEPPCPGQPTVDAAVKAIMATDDAVEIYYIVRNAMGEHGNACYDKGRADAKPVTHAEVAQYQREQGGRK
jgi:hypothetical protein